MAVTCQIKNYDVLKKQLETMKKAPQTVLDRTLSDAKKRTPGWIATEVTKQYGVKKGDISKGNLGSVKVEGNTLKTVRVVYRGRLLTPTHFGMTPKAPGKNAYTLKYRVVEPTKSKVKKLTKKQRAALGKNFTKSGTQTSDHSPIMLMHTGNTKAGGTSYIPFQRKSTDRKDVEAIKTLSLPQMVSSERTEANISNSINENLGKRLEHHMKLLQK